MKQHSHNPRAKKHSINNSKLISCCFCVGYWFSMKLNIDLDEANNDDANNPIDQLDESN